MDAATFAVAVGSLLAAGKVVEWLTKRRRKKPKEPLDTPLMRIGSGGDVFTRRDLLRSVSIMGASGSGKTSGSGLAFGRAIVKAKTGGLIIASKPEDREFWQAIFVEAGRADDLIIVAPDRPHRFNFIDFIGGDARETAQSILTVAETLTRMQGGGRDPFWDQQNRRTLHNAAEVLRQAYGFMDMYSIQYFINDAPISLEHQRSPEWRTGMHHRTILKAEEKALDDISKHDFNLAANEFWGVEWPLMNEKTRSSIVAGVMGYLHVFNTGIVRELISNPNPNISPAVMDAGKVVLVDMPVATHGANGAFVAGAWKYATQRHVLKRKAAPDTPITVIWIDEYQNHITSFDAKYLAECRSHHGCMVVLTQSLHSYFSSIGGTQAQSHAKGLLSNFGLRVFHALGDSESAEYASSLIGRDLMHLTTGSIPQSPPFVNRDLLSLGWSQQYESLLQGRAFMTGLRTGGADSGFMTDAWVVKSGMPFSTGFNYIKVSFAQS